MSATYDINDSAKLLYSLRDADGNPIDATVNFTSTKPDGSAGPNGLAADETGVGEYSFTLSPDQAGFWSYKFVASGTATDVTPDVFYVRPLSAANIYTTMAELKGSMQIDLADDQDDDDLKDAILSASRWIDAWCKRNFYQQSEIRTFAAEDRYHHRLGPYMDLVSVTTFKTDENADGVFETTWAASDYQLLTDDDTPNINAGPESKPYTQIRPLNRVFPLNYYSPLQRTNLIQIDGVWGWPQVPDGVRRAARILAQESFKLKDAPLGAAGIGDLGIIRIRDNPKARSYLESYRIRSHDGICLL